ncbi:MAG: methyltransferase domain-containing protein [Gemmataceae bacterium]
MSGQSPLATITRDFAFLIPADASVVVQVGPGNQELARVYKRINPKCRYVVISSEDDAERWEDSGVDQVLVADWNSTSNLVEFSKGSADCVVFFGAFERLMAPWKVLSEAVEWLKPDGQVLLGVPNVQHWSTLLALVSGKLVYRNQNGFPEDQLRFFSAETIKDIFDRCGVQLQELRAHGHESQDWQNIQQLLQPLLNALQIQPQDFAGRSRAQLYFARGIKQDAAPTKTLIQTIMAAPVGCDHIRVYQPNTFLTTIPAVRTLATQPAKGTGHVQLANPLPDEQRVLIWQRSFLTYPRDIPTLKNFVQQGYLLVAEMDDDPGRWREYDDMFNFRVCHAVQTSTETLADFFRPHNPNVGVFSNQLAILPPPRPTPGRDEPLTLFFGALNREEDWEPLMPAINRVLAKLGDKVRVEVIFDEKFFAALTIPDKQFTPFCPYEQYLQILGRCHVTLLPLRETRFNSMKSDLKFLECAGHSVAVLASPVVYSNSLRDGETGLLFTNEREFEDKLQRLLEDSDLRQRLVQTAYEYVRDNRMLSQHFRKRYDWYQQLIADLPRLNEELRQRVPEMFE